MNTEKRLINGYFDMLEDWKRLPAYKLEVRIDSFIGFALPKVIESIYGLNPKVIIPELPIRLGSLNRKYETKKFANRSYKVDFYIRTECGQNLFIEFKTDSGSRRDKKDLYLEQIQKAKMKSIVKGIIRIFEVTSYKKKYSHLLEKLQLAGLTIETEKGYDVNIGAEHIKILYIQPRLLEKDDHKEILDFKQLADAVEMCYPNSELMERLSLSLKKWSKD